ncbi:MAG: hypothetical protein HPZ91_05485 [Lentisphaeria bacterium]|nr:hypothetical protein [Lentisphaeria bacterium]
MMSDAKKKEKIEQINQNTPVLPQNIVEAVNTPTEQPVSVPKKPEK